MHIFTGKIMIYKKLFIRWNKKRDLVGKKHKYVWTDLNYIEQLLILVSTITGFISIFNFAFLVGIPVGVGSSATGLKVCTITAVIKTYKSMIKKKIKKHDKTVKYYRKNS